MKYNIRLFVIGEKVETQNIATKEFPIAQESLLLSETQER
jgi:hypothetical protein